MMETQDGKWIFSFLCESVGTDALLIPFSALLLSLNVHRIARAGALLVEGGVMSRPQPHSSTWVAYVTYALTREVI